MQSSRVQSHEHTNLDVRILCRTTAIIRHHHVTVQKDYKLLQELVVTCGCTIRSPPSTLELLPWYIEASKLELTGSGRRGAWQRLAEKTLASDADR